MAFARPTLAELIERCSADIEAGLPGADARLRRSNLNVLAKVLANSVHGLYGYLEWLSQQVLADQAEAAILERHAGIWGVLRVPAAFAEGPITVTGTDGVMLPAATKLQRGDGAEYVTAADMTIASGIGTVRVAAVAAGLAGNADAGTKLNLVAPVAGVNAQATVAAGGITQGADAESDDALRSRVVARIQQAPMGGAQADYVAWALEVPGVTRAWCYPLEGGPGKVVVRFVRDLDPTIIPDAAEVATVQAYIDALKPVTAQLTVAAPVATPLNLTIALTPNTAAVKAAVQAELADVLQREGYPGGTILLSHLREAVSVASGETNSVVTAPAADVTHSAGQLPVLGTITWA